MIITKLVFSLLFVWTLAQDIDENFPVNEDDQDIQDNQPIQPIQPTQPIQPEKPTVTFKEGRLTGDPLKEAERLLVSSLTKFAAGYGPFYKISEIYYVTQQDTTGKLYKYKTDLIDSTSSVRKCDVSIWSRPEVANDVEVTFNCEGPIIAHA